MMLRGSKFVITILSEDRSIYVSTYLWNNSNKENSWPRLALWSYTMNPIHLCQNPNDYPSPFLNYSNVEHANFEKLL